MVSWWSTRPAPHSLWSAEQLLLIWSWSPVRPQRSLLSDSLPVFNPLCGLSAWNPDFYSFMFEFYMFKILFLFVFSSLLNSHVFKVLYQSNWLIDRCVSRFFTESSSSLFACWWPVPGQRCFWRFLPWGWWWLHVQLWLRWSSHWTYAGWTKCSALLYLPWFLANAWPRCKTLFTKVWMIVFDLGGFRRLKHVEMTKTSQERWMGSSRMIPCGHMPRGVWVNGDSWRVRVQTMLRGCQVML